MKKFRTNKKVKKYLNKAKEFFSCNRRLYYFYQNASTNTLLFNLPFASVINFLFFYFVNKKKKKFKTFFRHVTRFFQI